MSMKDVRRGYTQAEFNETASNWLFGEILLLSVFLGLASSSWWVFGGLLLGMIFMLWVRKLAIILLTLLSIFWTVIVFGLGLEYGGYGAAFVLSIIVLLVTGGLHVRALEWVDDVQYTEE